MSLELWYHPLDIASQMAALALFECGADFVAHSIEDACVENARLTFLERWPTGQLPVLMDHNWDELIFGSSVIAEYLHVYGGSGSQLLPTDPEEGREVRRWTRLAAAGVAWPMSILCQEKLNLPVWVQIGPSECERALRQRDLNLPILEDRILGRTWLVEETFTIADCQLGPALLCCEARQELQDYPYLRDYLDRCWERPAFQKMLRLVGDRFLRYSDYPLEDVAPLVLAPPLLQRLREAKVISPRKKPGRPGEPER